MSTSWRPDAPNRQWYSSLNWTDGIPVSGQNADIFSASPLAIRLSPSGQTQPQHVGTLSVGDGSVRLYGGTLDFEPTINNDSLTYDLLVDQNATLTIASTATLVGHQTTMIGATGSNAHMNVLGAVSEDYALVKGGQLTVGAGGHWTAGSSGFVVGGVNGARLAVVNGGVIDGGRDDLAIASQSLYIGGYGAGSVTVNGGGSRLSETGVWIGAYAHGSLSILNGGVVQDQYAVVAYNGDADVLISGQGSRWDNFRGLQFGISYPTNSKLTIVDNGQLDWGPAGFRLDDYLYLDSTAVLGGQAIYDGGEVTALTNNGAVEIAQDIHIMRNWLFGGTEIASFSVSGPSALTLSGQITGAPDSVLRIGSGKVQLTNTGNKFGSVEIWSGALDARTTGALGAAPVDFIAGTQTRALLSINSAAPFDNMIEHLSTTDTVDVGAFHFSAGVSKTWVEDVSDLFGTLTLTNASKSFDLHFSGEHAASDFRLSNDQNGGMLVRLAATA